MDIAVSLTILITVLIFLMVLTLAVQLQITQLTRQVNEIDLMVKRISADMDKARR